MADVTVTSILPRDEAVIFQAQTTEGRKALIAQTGSANPLVLRTEAIDLCRTLTASGIHIAPTGVS